MKRFTIAAAAAAFAFAAACTPQATPPAAETAAEPAAPVAIAAPAGAYTLDKTHASLTFQVMHLGLSNYTARFTDFDASLNFDPANPTASTVTATINPASVETDYPGDYKATHADSGFNSWNEDLANSPNWLNAAAFPQITFTSTALTATGERTGTMSGDLTFLGVTQPVTLDVTFNGELNPHPMLQGRSAIGFSARGTLKRSDFGSTYGAAFIGDEVNLIIEAEFHQAPASE